MLPLFQNASVDSRQGSLQESLALLFSSIWISLWEMGVAVFENIFNRGRLLSTCYSYEHSRALSTFPSSIADRTATSTMHTPRLLIARKDYFCMSFSIKTVKHGSVAMMSVVPPNQLMCTGCVRSKSGQHRSTVAAHRLRYECSNCGTRAWSKRSIRAK